jgi:HlyD family secretion protein
MTANVSIVIAHKDDAVKVSNAALRYRPPDAAAAEPRRADAAGPPRGERGGRSGGGARERRSERTVYVLNGTKPQPVQIKTGISDGVTTEVTEGLKEGDRVVTAKLSGGRDNPPPAANPFGGGGRRGF